MNKNGLTKIISVMLLLTIAFYTLPVFAFTKDETVYSDLDSNGNPYKTIVSTHLKNDDASDVINDISDLLNIENVNGDEEFEQDGNNLIWDAKGSDIYYEGESQKELPIEVNVKYELDGEEISKDEILGKSGKVKITLEYTNKDEHTVNINGKYEKLYTPFVIVSGTTIENENNSNIEISNGKVISNGTKTIVLGVALPGMQESLGINKNTINIPNNIEITMETKSFELNNIITYVTPKIIEEDDLEIFDKLDKLYGKVNKIKKASEKIEDGANKLKEGTNLYTEKSKEFNNALNEFSNGITTANNSYTEINNGIDTLNQSSKILNQGANKIAHGTYAISQGLQEVDSNLENIKTGIVNLQQGETQIKHGLDQIEASIPDDTSTQIQSLNNLKQNNQATIQLLTGINSELENNIELLSEDNIEAITKIKTQIARNNGVIEKLNEANKTIDQNITALSSTPSSMQILKAGIKQVTDGVDSLSSGTDTLYTGISKIKEGTNTLLERSKELSDGAKTLNGATDELSKGTNKLNNGSIQMKNGLNILDTSGSLITNANGELTKGAESISEGASQLLDGITTFNSEAIDTIVGYINENLKDLQVRAQKLQQLANEYNNFTMLNDGTNGSVKFIMIMDSIKKQEEDTNKQEIVLNEEIKEKEE